MANMKYTLRVELWERGPLWTYLLLMMLGGTHLSETLMGGSTLTLRIILSVIGIIVWAATTWVHHKYLMRSDLPEWKEAHKEKGCVICQRPWEPMPTICEENDHAETR